MPGPTVNKNAINRANHTSTPGSSQLPTSSQTPSRVLVVEPHPTLRTVLVQRLRQDGHLAAVGSASEAVDLCREQSPDLLVVQKFSNRILPWNCSTIGVLCHRIVPRSGGGIGFFGEGQMMFLEILDLKS